MKTSLLIIITAITTVASTLAESQMRAFTIPADSSELTKIPHGLDPKQADFKGYALWGILHEEQSNKFAKDIKFVNGDKIELPNKAIAHITAKNSPTPSVLEIDLNIDGPNHLKCIADLTIYEGQSIVYRFFSEDSKPILLAIQIRN